MNAVYHELQPGRKGGADHAMPTTLVLVPTDLERRQLAPALATGLAGDDRIELCGFGPVAAAARTATLVAAHAPARVILVGIAGRFDGSLEIGAAYWFDRVACHGIGVGSGDGFVPAAALGWPQWPGDPAAPVECIGDVIDLAMPPGAGTPASSGLLLTTCAASATADDVAARRTLFPAATAEDMEGFGVALACRLRSVPLVIVRGISNATGDRDHARWRVTPALAAAAEVVLRMLKEQS
jgi:futalosine hydrolase